MKKFAKISSILFFIAFLVAVSFLVLDARKPQQKAVVVPSERKGAVIVPPKQKGSQTPQKLRDNNFAKKNRPEEFYKDIPKQKNLALEGEMLSQQGLMEMRDIFKPLDDPVQNIDQEPSSKNSLLPDADTGAGEYTLIGVFTATAYSGPEFNSDGITKTGTNTRIGVVAVDPEVIKLGSRVLVEGYGEAIAEDTGNKIKGRRIDLWLPSVSEANRYGVRNVKVWVKKH